MAKDSHKALLNQLKNPFDPRLVKWRVGGGGKQLAYIDARDVMKRLDEVVGAGKYKTRYTPVEGGFICELSIYLQMDDGSYEWITRSDGANNTKVEPIKGGISSALKRAANAWGIGRYLYYLDPNKFNKGNINQWPKWALPGEQVENWEDVAEMEVDSDFGMDQDEAEAIATETLKWAEQLNEASTAEELKAVVSKMSGDDQRIFANLITKKTAELVVDDSDNTDK